MIFAIKAIKYAFVNKIWFCLFQSSRNLSRLPFVFWQYRGEVTVQKRGFVFILAGFQSLLYFCTPQSIILYPLFCRPSFISRALLFSQSLAVSRSLPLLHRDFFFFPTLFQFHLVLYSNSSTGHEAHKQLTHPTLTAPPTSNHLPLTNHPALNTLTLPSPSPFPYSSCHPSSLCFSSPLLPPSPNPPLLLPPLPTGLEIVPLFLTSVLLGD